MPAFLFKLTPGDRGSNQVILELHVIGMKTAAAEALLVTVADAIAQDIGIENRLIHINSIGSGESAERYLRELSAFLRKQAEYLSATQRERIIDDPLGTLLSMKNAKTNPVLARAPSSMDYLSEDERRHFWDVLEYLELAGKIYELTPTVVGSSDCWTHTLFEMSYPKETPEGMERVPFALGGRYDTLAMRSLGPAAAAVHVAISFELKSVPQVKKSRWKPAAYLAHLGLEAKRRSIPILEILRQAEIPVYHSLAYDQIAPQMAIVKRLNLPWLLLMGHKEALANEIAVRNIKTNAQDTVPLSELAAYLHRKHIVA
jgi:histidyl-tRNA synthetase